MTKLNQIIAIEKTAKSQGARALTDAYHTAQKPALFAGVTRTYRPKDDDGDQLPPESTQVQVSVDQLLTRIWRGVARMLDVVATKDETNTVARADVKIDDNVILADVPATYLLYLEKQLADIRTFISKLPRLDPAESWHFDSAAGSGVSASDAVETHRTKKVPRAQVLYEATDKHPAQVRTYDEDVVVGYWKTTKFSGASPADRIDGMLERVDRLTDAIRQAREQANSVDVVDRVGVGEAVMSYIVRGQ